ncbi:uncharacterized protein LOC107778024 [Nicotiana tabacum]|uniref:UPF0481 protein At3g47200-like n=1 Tax=Nicotiana tabacum TaxID=4097 RepID=A0A1S3YNW6_TOBAC|nr:PREDICTED: UPF0481 protein At3g47200-like [Nicotiana tabacum]
MQNVDPILVDEIDSDNEWITENEDPVLPEDPSWLDEENLFDVDVIRMIDVESSISEIEKLKDEALKCYEDIGDADLGSDIVEKFSEMLFLDECFVVEYIRERSGMKPKGEDIIIKASCMRLMRGIVRRNLLLLENQLPFFVLTKLHDDKRISSNTIHKYGEEDLSSFLTEDDPASSNESECNAAEIKHLLQIVHMSCHPSKMKDMPRDKDHLKVMPNAIELSEAGVSFVKVRYIYRRLDEDDLRDSTSIFGVKFENGLMEIPCFEVDDNGDFPAKSYSIRVTIV